MVTKSIRINGYSVKIVLARLLYISQNSVLVKNMGFSESQPEFIIIDMFQNCKNVYGRKCLSL